jgi:hypothetical protein
MKITNNFICCTVMGERLAQERLHLMINNDVDIP